MNLIIEQDFASRLPGYRAVIIEANVVNAPTSPEQIEEMNQLTRKIQESTELAQVNKLAPIAATRAAYKACGKDPNRYRPSQEQLMRRIIRGLGLYNVNALVDAGNQLSLLSGCSVGCFDADKVVGSTLTLGIGREGEPYEGIGRGPLNIEGLPVFRDEVGGIGTPTSDNERTKLSLDTRRLLTTVHLFDTTVDADKVVNIFTDLFSRYGQASDIVVRRYSV